MTPDEMKKRTKAFALRCIKLACSFPKGPVGDTIGRQLIRSGTGVAANYRASCSARSHADFLNKLGIVEEEVDESLFWIELSAEASLIPPVRVEDLIEEGSQILAIIVSSQKTAKANRKKKQALNLTSKTR